MKSQESDAFAKDLAIFKEIPTIWRFRAKSRDFVKNLVILKEIPRIL